jgi:anti-sigma factor ChrR (cupin superfamily)
MSAPVHRRSRSADHAAADPLAGIDELLELRLAGLARSAGPAEPPPEILTRIEAAIERAESGIGATFVGRDEGAWEEIRTGVTRKMLLDSPRLGRRTYLLRLAPRATIADHVHELVEECFVLEGAIAGRGAEMHAGDYMLAPKGSLHQDLHSSEGCLLLIIETA